MGVAYIRPAQIARRWGPRRSEPPPSPNVRNATICCRFIQTEFNLSDRRQCSEISGSYFANNCWSLRLPVIESWARVGDPNRLSGNSNSRSTSKVKGYFWGVEINENF